MRRVISQKAQAHLGSGLLEGLASAWQNFRNHWRPFLVAQLLVGLAWLILECAVIGIHRLAVPLPAYAVLWLGLHLAFFWTFSALMLGLHAMALEVIDGRAPVVRLTVGRPGAAARYLLSSTLYWCGVLVGLCLLVIPGLVAASAWAPFRFLLTDRSGDAASFVPLGDAAHLSASHRWRLFRALMASTLLNLAGAALLGVGLLITLPVTIILRAGIFRDLQAQRRRAPP